VVGRTSFSDGFSPRKAFLGCDRNSQSTEALKMTKPSIKKGLSLRLFDVPVAPIFPTMQLQFRTNDARWPRDAMAREVPARSRDSERSTFIARAGPISPIFVAMSAHTIYAPTLDLRLKSFLPHFFQVSDDPNATAEYPNLFTSDTKFQFTSLVVHGTEGSPTSPFRQPTSDTFGVLLVCIDDRD
jgi:hypothetical protein